MNLSVYILSPGSMVFAHYGMLSMIILNVVGSPYYCSIIACNDLHNQVLQSYDSSQKYWPGVRTSSNSGSCY